jgi:hypothetical protein
VPKEVWAKKWKRKWAARWKKKGQLSWAAWLERMKKRERPGKRGLGVFFLI